jgi:hypothetical protein
MVAGGMACGMGENYLTGVAESMAAGIGPGTEGDGAHLQIGAGYGSA